MAHLTVDEQLKTPASAFYFLSCHGNDIKILYLPLMFMFGGRLRNKNF